MGGRTAFIVSGPSGAGKNTAIDRVVKTVPHLAYSVSCTTRSRRPGEVDGVDYHYVSHAAFERRVAEGDFLEHATYLGDRYGTSRSQIAALFARGDDVILNIDVEGAKTLRRDTRAGFFAVYVFFTTASLDSLRARLEERGTESPEEIAARLEVAKRELEALPLFDYLVLNERLEDAVAELRSIVLAARCRVVPGWSG
jgi:guanylate kinase